MPRVLHLTGGGLRAWHRRLAAERPEVVHADGEGPVRLAFLLSRWHRFPWVASGAARADGWLTRRALRAADRVVARNVADAARYKALGVAADRVAVIPPGVPPAPPLTDPVGLRRSLDVPDAARVLASDNLRSAAWAFDVLKYPTPDVYLVLVGDGSGRAAVERFARAIGHDDYRVRFAGPRCDFASVAGLAEVVWAPHERGGEGVALAGMAAGKPVVAADTPDLAAVVADGVTGRLVPPGDPVRMAAVTRELLDDPAAARRLGEAGRERAEGFSAAEMADRYARLYDELARASPR